MLEDEESGGEHGLSLVPEVPAASLGPIGGPPARTGLSPIDVVMCCATEDLPAMGRIFDALVRHGCIPMAMTGAERDPGRLTESAQAAGEARLYVVCKTRSIDAGQARRLVSSFAKASRRGRHQLLVLEIELARIYAAVPHIRRGADQLRRRLYGAGAFETARTQQMPRVTLRPQRARAEAAVPAPLPEAPRVDTSYSMHSGPEGSYEAHIDRVVADVEPLPSAPTRVRVSPRVPLRRAKRRKR